MANEQKFETRKTIGPVRLSYSHLWEPYAKKPTDKPKYSTAILIPKADKKTVYELQTLLSEAKKAFAAKYPNLTVSRIPIKDGNKPNTKGKMPPDEYREHFYINCKVNKLIPIVKKSGGKTVPITDHGEVYSGCWGYVEINFFPYSNEGDGISVGLNSFCKTRDDVSLEGGTDPDTAFADVPEEGSYGNAEADSNDEPFA